jgi:hypothetical protein
MFLCCRHASLKRQLHAKPPHKRPPSLPNTTHQRNDSLAASRSEWQRLLRSKRSRQFLGDAVRSRPNRSGLWHRLSIVEAALFRAVSPTLSLPESVIEEPNLVHISVATVSVSTEFIGGEIINCHAANHKYDQRALATLTLHQFLYSLLISLGSVTPLSD